MAASLPASGPGSLDARALTPLEHVSVTLTVHDGGGAQGGDANAQPRVAVHFAVHTVPAPGPVALLGDTNALICAHLNSPFDDPLMAAKRASVGTDIDSVASAPAHRLCAPGSKRISSAGTEGDSPASDPVQPGKRVSHTGSAAGSEVELQHCSSVVSLRGARLSVLLLCALHPMVCM